MRGGLTEKKNSGECSSGVQIYSYDDDLFLEKYSTKVKIYNWMTFIQNIYQNWFKKIL